MKPDESDIYWTLIPAIICLFIVAYVLILQKLVWFDLWFFVSFGLVNLVLAIAAVALRLVLKRHDSSPTGQTCQDLSILSYVFQYAAIVVVLISILGYSYKAYASDNLLFKKWYVFPMIMMYGALDFGIFLKLKEYRIVG